MSNNINNVVSISNQQNMLANISPPKFIPRLQTCIDVLKKLSNHPQGIAELSQLPTLIHPWNNDCSIKILSYAPPSSAGVCKAWQKCHEILWKKLQSDHPLENLAALKNERIRHQMSINELENGGFEDLNLSFIGKELLKTPKACVDKEYQPIKFEAENFEKLPLSAQAKRVYEFFKSNQDHLYELELKAIGLTAIPQVIFTLQNLNSLDLYGNKIFTVETNDSFNLKNLRYLRLHENPIKKFPKDLFIKLCNQNYFSGRYQAKYPWGRTNAAYHGQYPVIKNTWQYVLTDRCEWMLFQFWNDVNKSIAYIRGLKEQFLIPNKSHLESLKSTLSPSDAAAVQDLLEMTDWESIESLSKKIDPMYNLYARVLPDVATGLVSLEFLGKLMTSKDVDIERAPWNNLHEAITKFIDAFLLLQDRFVDVEIMKDLIQKYETVISIVKDKACFAVNVPNKTELLEERETWIKEQEKYLDVLKQRTEEIGILDATSLNLAKLFMDRSKDEYPIMYKKINDIARYIKEMFKATDVTQN